MIVELSSRTTKVGGEARVVAELFTGLQKYFKTCYLGFNTHYISEEGPSRIILKKKLPVGAQTRKLSISELRIMRLAYNLVFVRRMKWFGLSKEENKRIIDYAPDVIIANSLSDFPLLAHLKGKINFKTVYIDHGSISTAQLSGYFSKESIPLTVGSGISGASVEEIKRKFFSFFDVSVALNKNQYKEIKKLTDKAAYIPNGMNVVVKDSKTSTDRFRARYNIAKDDFVFMYLGRMFERQKRISTLIAAFKMTKNRKFKLVLAGSGPSIPEYVALAKGDSRIVFTHELQENQIPSAYETADTFILPSMWEGFSIVMLEAAAHKLPLILSNNAYVDDIKLKNIGTIPSFRTGDASALYKLLEKMYNDKRFRTHAIASSAAIAREFTPDRMLKQYKEVIDKIS